MRVLLVMLAVLASGCRDAPAGHRLEGPLFVPAALPDCAAMFCGVESRAALDNPHQGFETFHRRALSLSKHPGTRVAYERFWWSELEPEEGVVKFELIDEALNAAAAAGQTFAFRVMPEESREGAQRVPRWLAEAAGGTWGVNHGARYFSPDYNSPAAIAAIERTVAALGARYDGDPRVEHVDVGFVGDTGEWAYVVEGASMPSAETTARILNAFAKAFTKTRVLMNLGAVDDGARPLRTALELGMGWRADCWGDLRKGWNHHDDFYEQQLEAAQALDAWKRAPVAVETCGEMEMWDLLGMDTDQVRWVLRWALDHHVSILNNKSRAVPARYRPLVDEFLGYAGPRLFVWRATREGSALKVGVLNRGTTPPLWPWRLAARVRGGDTIVAPAPLTDVIDAYEATFSLAGVGAVDVALLDERGTVIHLANEGVREDGWLEVAP